MEKRRVKRWLALAILAGVGMLSFLAGIAWAGMAWAADKSAVSSQAKREPRVVYPKRSELDFEGARIEGEIRNPGEFYFQRRPEEKFDSLVKRRKTSTAR